jgi:hypothetical protein
VPVDDERHARERRLVQDRAVVEPARRPPGRGRRRDRHRPAPVPLGRHGRERVDEPDDSHAETCNTSCVDDSNEDDDTFSQARTTGYPSYNSTAQKICPNDDDWFKVTLYSNEVLTMDLAFTQSDESQDLDLHLYQDSTDLWPCDPANVSSCTPAHGQGAVSNEHATFTAPSTCSSGCDYYVVVRGWNGASNTYGITLGIQ